jgi:hypothetical protein
MSVSGWLIGLFSWFHFSKHWILVLLTDMPWVHSASAVPNDDQVFAAKAGIGIYDECRMQRQSLSWDCILQQVFIYSGGHAFRGGSKTLSGRQQADYMYWEKTSIWLLSTLFPNR